LLAINLIKPKSFLNLKRNQAQFLKFRKPTKIDFRKQVTENRLQITEDRLQITDYRQPKTKKPTENKHKNDTR
jgi:hypothetical protein